MLFFARHVKRLVTLAGALFARSRDFGGPNRRRDLYRRRARRPTSQQIADRGALAPSAERHHRHRDRAAQPTGQQEGRLRAAASSARRAQPAGGRARRDPPHPLVEAQTARTKIARQPKKTRSPWVRRLTIRDPRASMLS